jgi:uncharacterized RDD family membrane protein YckC
MNGNANNNFKGYHSEEEKQKFTFRVGILCAIVIVLQSVLPFIVMIPMFLTMSSIQSDTDRQPNLYKSVIWHGDIWYIEESWNNQETQSNALLKRISLSDKKNITLIAMIPAYRPWLLADTGKLWILSSTMAGYYDGDTLIINDTPTSLGEISQPFLLNRMPAVLEGTPAGINLVSYDGNDWKYKSRLNLGAGGDSIFLVNNFKVIAFSNRIILFHTLKSTLFYREGLPISKNQENDSWQIFGPVGNYFYPLWIGTDPAIFSMRHSKITDSENLVGFVLQGREWLSIFSINQPSLDQYAVFPIGKDEFIVVTESFMEGVQTIKVRNNEIIAKDQYGSQRIFPTPIMIILMSLLYCAIGLLPLILVFIYTPMMKKYRLDEYEFEGRKMKYASLNKRAFAYLIDGLISSAPILIGFGVMILSLFRVAQNEDSSNLFAVYLILIMFGSFLWLFIVYFIFSFLEGKYGQTPGKKILRIKVLGTNLQPCGFGRALLRNLLSMVDSFYNYIVGIVCVALNEHWQRIGDMAAKTIVVETEKTPKI